jgi:hypothetical protein
VQSSVDYDKLFRYSERYSLGTNAFAVTGNFNSNFTTTYTLNGIGQLTNATVAA